MGQLLIFPCPLQVTWQPPRAFRWEVTADIDDVSHYTPFVIFGHGIKRLGDLDFWPLRSLRTLVIRSSYSISVPSLKYVGLPILKMWLIFSHVINRPLPLTFWPLNGVTDHQCRGFPSCQLWACYVLPLLNLGSGTPHGTDREATAINALCQFVWGAWGRGHKTLLPPYAVGSIKTLLSPPRRLCFHWH